MPQKTSLKRQRKSENDVLFTKKRSFSDHIPNRKSRDSQNEHAALLSPRLLKASHKKSASEQSFVIASSLHDEFKLTMTRSMLMSLQMVSQMGVIVVVIIFVGQLPDSALYLAGVGFGRTFVNVTGTAMAWGMTTALFTLLPQSVGAGRFRHCAIHVQRAFYITTVAACFLSIAQFYAGELIALIGQPADLQPIVSTYCRVAIPYIFVISYCNILQVLLQTLDLNPYITWCSMSMLIVSPFCSWIFILRQGWFYGAALASIISMTVFIIGMVIIVVRSGYGFVFKPLPLSVVLTKKGVSQYISLAIPGLFQNAFEWIIQEVAVILAGYVVQSTTALSTTVILSNLMMVVMAFMVGISNAANVRVGKYIGRADVVGAKRAAKAGVLIAMLMVVVFGVMFIFGRKAFPVIYTSNQETIDLTSSMMIVLWLYASGCIIINVFGGIYRGMGIQKASAIMVFVAYWVISFPLSLVLLFGLDLRENLYYGLFVIWGSLAAGNMLGCIAEIVYLRFCADWRASIHSALVRVRHTMSDTNVSGSYDSTNRSRNGKIQADGLP